MKSIFFAVQYIRDIQRQCTWWSLKVHGPSINNFTKEKEENHFLFFIIPLIIISFYTLGQCASFASYTKWLKKQFFVSFIYHQSLKTDLNLHLRHTDFSKLSLDVKGRWSPPSHSLAQPIITWVHLPQTLAHKQYKKYEKIWLQFLNVEVTSTKRHGGTIQLHRH